MNLTLDLKSVEGVTVGVAHGPLGLDDIRSAAESFWQSVDGPNAQVLWDLRNAVFDLKSDEVRDIADFTKQHSPFDGLKMAFLVSRDLEYGLLRMFDVFRETNEAQTAVFRDKSQALDWLSQEE